MHSITAISAFAGELEAKVLRTSKRNNNARTNVETRKYQDGLRQ